ncbi:MAG TPA: methyltransferase domain-containing protein [Stellaceae bacterium]|nr:methyltransferase domain-containing protein [Stellaceae bacterium]
MISSLDRFVYRASQGARFSWFFGQKLLAARLTDKTPTPPEIKARMPSTRRLLADLRALLRRDLDNIAAGLYRLPAVLGENPLEAFAKARQFFADLAVVNERRQAGRNSEVREQQPAGKFPRYYLQNFHYQTDGYLSEQSAALYDHQVEVLFSGGADAMRRQALVPLAEAVRRRGIRASRLLDIGCGTGRFLREVKANYPRLAVTALDLSPFYLAEARKTLAPWSRTRFIEAPAEAVPEPDASYDIVTSVYLFHELPAKPRRLAAAEMARLLAPGGTLILVDSLQIGDVPDYDALLEYFPVSFHEPYFANYARDDLAALFAPVGLTLERVDLAYLSKVVTFRKEPSSPSSGTDFMGGSIE